MRVVVGEDQFLLTAGLVRLLKAHGFQLAAAAGEAPSLLHTLVTHTPDVATVDVRLPPSFTDDGLRVAIETRRARCSSDGRGTV